MRGEFSRALMNQNLKQVSKPLSGTKSAIFGQMMKIILHYRICQWLLLLSVEEITGAQVISDLIYTFYHLYDLLLSINFLIQLSFKRQ